MLSVTVSPQLSSAHSGGTDEYGCHSGSQAYHCHSDGVDMAVYYNMLKLNGLSKTLNFKSTLKRYSSCTTLNRIYLRGVAKSKGRNSDFRQYVSKRLYSLNKHLDVDKNGIACGFMDPENKRIMSKVCAPMSGIAADGMTSMTAYQCVMPAQPVSEIGGGWQIELLTRTPNAGLAIKSVSIEDSPAPVGSQYYMVKLKVTNLTGSKSDFPTRLLGAQGVSGRQYGSEASCPSSWLGIGKPLLLSQFGIPNGESVVGNVCWTVLSEDADGLRVTLRAQRSCNCNMYTFIDRIVFISFG